MTWRTILLQDKIIMMCCALTLLASFIVGSFAYFRTQQISVDLAILGLKEETSLIALEFKSAFKEMENDAFIVANTPPIEGIIRTRHGQVDPKDGSTAHQWKARLETIFTSVMQGRSHYTQMRYIGIENNGLELVRVNRSEDGSLVAVPTTELQQKGQENYFREALDLKPGAIYLSDVSYNREHGQVTKAREPSIRVVIPVFYEGSLFGFVVINANYADLLHNTFLKIKPNKKTLIFNQLKDFASYDPSSGRFLFIYRYSKPLFKNARFDGPNSQQTVEIIYDDEEYIVQAIQLQLNSRNPNTDIIVAIQAPRSDVMKGASRTQQDTMLLVLLLIAFCFLTALILTRRLTLPLRNMTMNIASSDLSHGELENLPVEQQDEIGELAKAFQQVTTTLRKNEVQAQNVLENIVEGIFTLDSDGTITSFNPACEKIFGYTAETAIGNNIIFLLQEPMVLRDFEKEKFDVDDPVKKTSIFQIETKGKRSLGKSFDLELTINQIKTRDGIIYTGIARDISERKRIENMKNEFISTVNHELRTPLTSIQGALGLLKSKYTDSLDAKGARWLEIANDECERLTHLVNDILDMEKIAAGKLVYHLEAMNICCLVGDIVDKQSVLANKYDIRFKLELEEDDILSCRVDPLRFEQALVNLLSNAAKYSPPGEEVTVIVKRDKEQVRITVADKGTGIPENFKPYIFGKFAQADSTTTRKKGGTGLGLNITKSIIEAFDGQISFDSTEGEGAYFHFILPLTNIFSGAVNE